MNQVSNFAMIDSSTNSVNNLSSGFSPSNAMNTLYWLHSNEFFYWNAMSRLSRAMSSIAGFSYSQSNGKSQINPNGVHQAFALMASRAQSQAVHQSLIPKFSSNFVISSITPQSRNSDIDLTHSIFSSKIVNRTAFSLEKWIIETRATDHIVHSLSCLTTVTASIHSTVQ